MKPLSLIAMQDQDIIAPSEAGRLSPVGMRAMPVSRRNVLRGGGALAVAAPMGIVASSALLLSTPAHAGTLSVTTRSQQSRYSTTLNGVSHEVIIWDTTTAGKFLIAVHNKGTGKIGYIFRNNTVTRVFNSATLSGSTFNLSNEVCSALDSGLFDSDIDGGRKLSTINWSNPAGSSITSQGDLSNKSDALTLFWEVYRNSNLVTYSGAIIQKVTSSGTVAFSTVLRFTGAKHNTFVNKRTAYANAVTNLHAVHGRIRTTYVLAGVAMFAGAVGSVFSAGASAAVVGGAIVAMAGNNVLSGQALIDATGVVSTTWYDMLSWVEAQTGENLVR